MESIKEKIAVMQAFADGKQIQRLKDGLTWVDDEDPIWDWHMFYYRVKPERHLPKTWEDFCRTHPKKIDEAYISVYSDIHTYIYDNERDANTDKNILPNKNCANAVLALCQLIQLRDCYNEGWQPDWEDNRSNKYIIELYADKTIKRTGCSYWRVLAFKTEELRDEFLENFKELIKIARPVL